LGFSFRTNIFPPETDDPFWQSEEGAKVGKEKIAQRFNVNRMAVGIAFSKLKKDGLIISKRGVGSFVVRLLKILRFSNSFRDLCLPIF
jgi:hypothetical protein